MRESITASAPSWVAGALAVVFAGVVGSALALGGLALLTLMPGAMGNGRGSLVAAGCLAIGVVVLALATLVDGAGAGEPSL